MLTNTGDGTFTDLDVRIVAQDGFVVAHTTLAVNIGPGTYTFAHCEWRFTGLPKDASHTRYQAMFVPKPLAFRSAFVTAS